MTIFSGFDTSSGFEILLKSLVKNVPMPNEALKISAQALVKWTRPTSNAQIITPFL
jgi:hypothetical protein